MVGFCKDGDEPSGSVTDGDFTYFLSCYPYVCILFAFVPSTFFFFSCVTHCLGVRTFCDASYKGTLLLEPIRISVRDEQRVC